MLRLCLRVYLVLEKKILKAITICEHGGHLGQWTATNTFVPLSQGGSTRYLSNIGPEASDKKSFEILPIQMYGPVQMHKEAKLTSP